MAPVDNPETLAATTSVVEGGPGTVLPPGRGYSLRSVLQSSALYSVSDFVLKLIGFFLVPLYTRAMTPNDYGIIGYTTALTQILSPVLSLGLISSMPMLYYAYSGRERGELVSTVINFVVLYAGVMTILLTFAAPLSARFSPDVPIGYVILAIWALLFSTFYFVPLGLYNMEERPMAYSAYSIALSLVSVGANILFVLVLRMGALGALWAALVSGVAGFGVALFTVRRYYHPVLDHRKLGAVLALSLPVLPHLFSGTLLKFADRLFLTSKSTLAATGIYSLAMTMASILPIALGGAYAAMNPLFLRRANAADPRLPSDWARLCSLFVAATGALAVGLAIAGPYLVRLLTPASYDRAAIVLPVLVAGQSLVALYWLMSPLIGFTRRTWIYSAASIPAMLLNLGLNAVLVPRYGEMGAAWTMTLTSGVQLAIGSILTHQYFRVPYEYGQLGKITVVCAAAWAVSRVWRPEGTLISAVVSAALIAAVPAALVAWQFFERSELDAARRFATAIGRRLSSAHV
jgi:O-antigen/teichoic acid export membrane protein